MNNKETIKLDYLIKIALGLILLSGIIFATTSWDSIPDIVKLIMVVIFGLSSYGLSIFTSKVLKLEKSSFMYWVLSIICLVVFVIGIAYFEALGTWFSFTGDNSLLVLSTIMCIIGLALIRATYKTDKNIFMHISWFMFTIGIFLFGAYLNIEGLYTLAFLSIFLSLLWFVKKNNNRIFNSLKKMDTILLIMIFLIGDYANIIGINNLAFLVLGFALLFNLFATYLIEGNKNISPIITISTIVIIASDVNLLKLDDIALETVIVMCLFALTHLAYIALCGKDKTFTILNNIFFNFGLLCTLAAFDGESELIILIGLGVVLIANVLMTTLYDNNAERVLRPIKLLFFLIQCVEVMKMEELGATLLITSILTFIILIFDFVSKSKGAKISYTVIYTIALFFSALENVDICKNNPFDIIVYMLVLAYLVFDLIHLMRMNENGKKVWFYIGFIFILFYVSQMPFIDDAFVRFLFGTMTCILMGYFKIDDKKGSIKGALLCELIPLLTLTSYFADEVFFYIVGLYLLAIPLVYRYVINDENYALNKVLFVIGSLLMLGSTGIFYTIGMWAVLLFFIMLSYRDENYAELFYYGTVLLIFTLIIRLIDFWSSIPFYVYLFVAGILIIGFVTKMEYDKSKGIENKKKLRLPKVPKKVVAVTQTSVKAPVTYCTECGTLNYSTNIFCTGCGKTLGITKKFCTECGKPLEGEGKFCIYCGSKGN